MELTRLLFNRLRGIPAPMGHMCAYRHRLDYQPPHLPDLPAELQSMIQDLTLPSSNNTTVYLPFHPDAPSNAIPGVRPHS